MYYIYIKVTKTFKFFSDFDLKNIVSDIFAETSYIDCIRLLSLVKFS